MRDENRVSASDYWGGGGEGQAGRTRTTSQVEDGWLAVPTRPRPAPPTSQPCQPGKPAQPRQPVTRTTCNNSIRLPVSNYYYVFALGPLPFAFRPLAHFAPQTHNTGTTLPRPMHHLSISSPSSRFTRAPNSQDNTVNVPRRTHSAATISPTDASRDHVGRYSPSRPRLTAWRCVGAVDMCCAGGCDAVRHTHALRIVARTVS